MTEKDPMEASSGKRGRKGVIVFFVGLVAGVALVLVAQPFLGSRLPQAVGGKRESVQGPVAAKQRNGDVLLLTIVTPEGAILGTFEKDVDKIDLLVEVGDPVRLEIPGYQPFLQDPRITWVGKPELGSMPGSTGEPADVPADSGGIPEIPTDSVQESDSATSETASRWYD
jgi:hypothetical protein